MTTLFLQLLNMSMTASWLIVVVIFIRFLMQKAPKGMRYILWALVGIRLLCPFSIESALSLIPSAEVFSEESLYLEKTEIHTGVIVVDKVVYPLLTVPDTDKIPEIDNDATVDTPINSSPVQNQETAVDNVNTDAETIFHNSINMASIVWLLGIVGLLIYATVSYLRLRSTLKASMQVEDKIWVCDEIQSPFIMGLVSPRIYMPSYISVEYKPYILAHEMEHLRYKDHWWKPLGYAILAIHWFNPLVWVAYILMCRDIELACDERVIRRMGVEEKKNYSKSLLICSNPRHFISACPVAFGEIGVKERIKKIVDYKKPSIWIAGIGVLICIIVAICFMTNPKDIPSDNTEGIESTEGTEVEEDTEFNQDSMKEHLGTTGRYPYVEGEPLDESILRWFETEFFNNDENLITNMFLTSEYNSPADIDLSHLFYGGADGRTYQVSQKEIQLLEQQYDIEIELDVTKVTRKEMDHILQKYIGLTRDETNQINLSNLYYLEEYDAFYNVAGDTMMTQYVIEEGRRNENGTITLQYYDALGSYSPVCQVTLREKDGNYYFVSNVIAMKSVYVDVGVRDEELTLMQKVMFNKAPYSGGEWIGEVDGIYWSEFEEDYLKYVNFFNVDLDRDGVDEVCVEYQPGLVLVFHEKDGVVYGHEFYWREFRNVYKDGTFSGSNSASNASFCGNVVFEEIFNSSGGGDQGYSYIKITTVEYDNDTGEIHYYKGGRINNEEITKEEYDQIMSNYAMEEVERYGFTVENILKYVN